MDRYLFVCTAIDQCFIVRTGTKREHWERDAVWTGESASAGDAELARLNGWRMMQCPKCAGSKCDACNQSGKVSEQRAAQFERKRKQEER